MRHAIAESRDSARWPDDSKRPLTSDGSKRFGRAAQGLMRLVPQVDGVLSSVYVRAWQTAEILDEAGWPTPEKCESLEAPFPPGAVLEALRGRSEASLALVGHEPQLSSLGSLLAAGSEDVLRLELKKGAVAFLSFGGPVEAGGADLRWSLSPKILRALAPAHP